MGFYRNNNLLSRLVKLISILKVLLLIKDATHSLIILINGMWFIYNLHLLIFLITRPDYLPSIFQVFLGSLVRLGLVFAKILPLLLILSCMCRDLFKLSFGCCLLIALFFFFNCYFSDRLGLNLVGHFKMSLITLLCRLRWILLDRSWSSFFPLIQWLGLSRFCLLRNWRYFGILHDFIPLWLLTIFLHLLLLLLFCLCFFGDIKLRFRQRSLLSRLFFVIFGRFPKYTRFSVPWGVRILLSISFILVVFGFSFIALVHFYLI